MDLYETPCHVFSKLGKIKTAMALVVLFFLSSHTNENL